MSDDEVPCRKCGSPSLLAAAGDGMCFACVRSRDGFTARPVLDSDLEVMLHAAEAIVAGDPAATIHVRAWIFVSVLGEAIAARRLAPAAPDQREGER